MDPSTLEMLIMLKLNKDLWYACEVDEAMKRSTPPGIEIISIAPASSAPVPGTSLAGKMIACSSSSSSSF